MAKFEIRAPSRPRPSDVGDFCHLMSTSYELLYELMLQRDVGDFLQALKFFRHSSLPSLILDAGCAIVSLYDEIRHLFGTIMFIECTFR